MQTAYTTSEAMGSVSVCVDISSAQLARNVSVTLRSVPAGAAVGKPFKFLTQRTPYAYHTYQLYNDTTYGYYSLQYICICKTTTMHCN